MISELQVVFSDCEDFVSRSFYGDRLQVVYFSTLIGNDELVRDVVTPFTDMNECRIAEVLANPPYEPVIGLEAGSKAVLEGKAVLQFHDSVYQVDIRHAQGRSIADSEEEAVISGPHDAFVENIAQNVGLIRNRIKSPYLKTVRVTVGTVTQTDVTILYLSDVVNENMLTEIQQKLKDIDIRAIYSTTMVTQLIEEKPYSIFPQFMLTERPDFACSQIVQGRIVCLVDGSPSAFSLPSSFFEFFSSPEDYYQRWSVGTALRMLRLLGLIIALVITPLYVAVTTYHYEIIPFNMLLNLTESRRKVPFPPIMEAFLMEITLELLREAGVRMPTKIGSTIGIVGGIVIGQAAVQAGFTSIILIIAVAVSAIASFVIPNYVMSASVRTIRFALLMLAGIWGLFGFALGIGFIIIHLASITNMGTSYVTPLAPLNVRDWLDIFIRGPIQKLKNKPSQTRGKP